MRAEERKCEEFEPADEAIAMATDLARLVFMFMFVVLVIYMAMDLTRLVFMFMFAMLVMIMAAVQAFTSMAWAMIKNVTKALVIFISMPLTLFVAEIGQIRSKQALQGKATKIDHVPGHRTSRCIGLLFGQRAFQRVFGQIAAGAYCEWLEAVEAGDQELQYRIRARTPLHLLNAVAAYLLAQIAKRAVTITSALAPPRE